MAHIRHGALRCGMSISVRGEKAQTKARGVGAAWRHVRLGILVAARAWAWMSGVFSARDQAWMGGKKVRSTDISSV